MNKKRGTWDRKRKQGREWRTKVEETRKATRVLSYRI
jgi:hypothetical protein